MKVTHSHKLAAPGISGQVPRPKQVAALSAALGGAPLVWLLGLPGAGKTSIAAQWSHDAVSLEERCIWYRLDEDDADIAGLFDALRHHPRHGAPHRLPAWSPENQPDLRRFSQRFFSQLAGTAEHRLTVILDDCHRVPDGSSLFDVLDAAREVCGETLRFLLIGRRPPPLPLARGVVPGWLVVYDDLSLTLDEATAVAETVSGRRWQPDEARALQAAHGWMAHVLALARSGRTGPLAGDSSVQVGEFLCSELLLMLAADDRRALRLMAELPEMPRALAPRHLPPAVSRFLDQMAARRYFVNITANDAWRLHDLLRDGLRAQNQMLESAEQMAAARRERAGWVMASAPDTAMNLHVAAGDTAGALSLLREYGRSWLAQGRHQQVLAWLAALPLDEPDALLWRAEALLPGAPEDARPLFAHCRAALVTQGQAAGAYRAWCGEVASYVVQWGAVQGLAELVDKLEDLQAQFGPAPDEWRFRTAADALTALMYGRAEDPRIQHYAQATALAVQQAPDAGSRIVAAAQLLIYRLWWAGDFPAGRALYDAFDAEVEAGTGLAPLARLIWWSNAAIVDWQCGDPQRCYDKVERGLALADSSGVHVRDFFLLTQGIFCALAQEDWPRAEAYLARLAATERSHKRLDTMVHHFFRSWYALSRGDAALALAHTNTAMPLADSIGSLFHKVIVLSALAPAALHSGNVEAATQAYRAQLALAKGSQNLTFAYIAFCSGAEIALVSGDNEALAKQVGRMLTVKHLGGFHSDCGWRTPVRARLLAFALTHGIQPDVARQWIREKRIPPPAGYSGDWPMPVRIRALAGLEVEVDGMAPEEAGAKPSSRLRELLAALVARGEKGATQAELCDWLWPDAEGDKAQASLKVAVHRLRGWLGSESVLTKNGVVSLNRQRVACDLWLRMDGEHPALGQQAQQALAGMTSPPVEQLRRRLGANA